MKSWALRLVAFLAFIATTQASMANDEVNKFDLRDIQTVDQAIDSVTEKDFDEMSEDDDVAYRAFVTRLILNGEKVPGLCGDMEEVTCEEQINLLSGNGKIREILNRGKGEYVRLRTTPRAGPYMVQHVFSIRPIQEAQGLVLYVAVSGDGYKRAGLPDYVKSTFGIGDDTYHKASQAGVILLLKFR